MQVRDVLGYIFLPLVLIIAGSATRWGYAYESPFSWFCWSFAIALLVVGGTSLVFQSSPGQIPVRALWLVYVTCVVLLAAEFFIAYQQGDSQPDEPWRGIARHVNPFRLIIDWIVFAVLLLVLLWIPRKRREEPGDTH